MNTIVIDIDSLRVDHIGAYGYEAPTTPNIDALAEDGVRFTRAYAANSPCMPSRAALVSGRYGIHNSVATHGPSGQRLAEPRTQDNWTDDPASFWTLPEVLFNNRVQTGAVSSFPRHPAQWFYHVWHEFYTPQEPAERPDDVPVETPAPSGLPDECFQTPRANSVADIATEYIERHADNNFMLYAQFWDPHEPYNRTNDEIDPFRDGTPLPPVPTDEMIESHLSWDVVRGAQDMNVRSRSDLHELLARYDAEIRYADRHVGRIIDSLKNHEIYDDSLVILTADHGEEFGEHGEYRHHWSTYDGTQRIPLVIKAPVDAVKQTEIGTACEKLVTNVDLAPTVVDFSGLDCPAGWQGWTLEPLLTSENASWRSHVVFDHGLYMAQRAVRNERWKLIRTHHPGLWDGVMPETQLYDMRDDPWEQQNVASEHPDIVDALEMERRDWADRHCGPEEDSLHRVARKGPAGYRWFRSEWDGV